MAVEQFDLDDYDLVISTSHCAAKSVVVTGRARHLCYCLTPMRCAWDQFDAYFGPERVGTVPSALLRPVLAGLARWDRMTEGRVPLSCYFSICCAEDRAYYNRASTLVYPPVDTEYYSPVSNEAASAVLPTTSPDHQIANSPHFLVVSALVPYSASISP